MPHCNPTGYSQRGPTTATAQLPTLQARRRARLPRARWIYLIALAAVGVAGAQPLGRLIRYLGSGYSASTADGIGCPPPAASFVISSSSMEPTLFGPAQAAQCQHCDLLWWVNDSTFDPLYPLECPDCGSRGRITPITRIGQTLPAQAIRSLSGPPPLGSLIVFRDPSQPAPEVKRLVGRPGERIELRQGDIWRNHHRWQKSVPDGLSTAVLVHVWEPSKRDSDPFGSNRPGYPRRGWSPVVMDFNESDASRWYYQHLRSDRSGPGRALVAGPIRAELSANHAISWPDTDARDVGLVVQLAAVTGELGLAIWTPCGPIAVQLSLEQRASGSRICLWWLDGRLLLGVEASPPTTGANVGKRDSGSGAHLWLDDQPGWQVWQWHADIESTRPVDSGNWRAVSPGGGPPAAGKLDLPIVPIPLAGAGKTFPELGSDRPVGISWRPRVGNRPSAPRAPIDWAWVIRDLHYTGPNGETDFLVTSGGPDAAGLIVLGDNPAIAYDSRQRWPGGLPSDSVIGQLKLAGSPWSSLESQAKSRHLEVPGGGHVSR